jgi:rhodanese-related sulfurtransferase
MNAAPALDPSLPMAELLKAFPGAQRALFRQYHVGGCSSCGFRPDETLEQICARNEQMKVGDVVAFLESSHAEDQKMMINADELREALNRPGRDEIKLLDIRTREEFEAVHIDGSVHFTQPLMNEILMKWPREKGAMVLIDHVGQRSLDATAYFFGQGFTNARALAGGIDSWAEQVDPGLPRYTLE